MYNYNILFYLYHKENHSLYIQPLFLIKDIPYLENTEEIHILHFLYYIANINTKPNII